MRARRCAAFLASLACAGGGLCAASAASAEAGGEKRVPEVTGPVSGEPSSLVSVDLADFGYVQEEFFLEGTAQAYAKEGEWGTDGRWAATPTTTAPYTTRILVRRPDDPDDFRGTVVVEWLNVSGGVDAEPDWGMQHDELLRGGYIWVGVTAQEVGRDALQRANPTRYASLSHPGDDYSFDIYSQAGRALRDPEGDAPIPDDFDIEHVLADGESQSAIYLVTYVNAIQPLDGVYDGFLVHSRFGNGSPLTQDAGPDARPPDGSQFRSDVDEPVLVVETESDVPSHFASRQPDSDTYRLWEVAGSAHFDLWALSFLTGTDRESAPPGGPLSCVLPINDANTYVVVEAAIHRLARWVEAGKAPPKAPRLEVTPGSPPTIVRDEHGNALGGIRLPDVEVPVATLTGGGDNSPGFCGLFGRTIPFDAATLAELYPTHDDYVDAYRDAVQQLREDGFILKPEAKTLVKEAEDSDVGG